MNTRFLQQISLVSLAAAIATFGSFKAQAQATVTPTNTQLSNKAVDLYLWAQVPEQTTPAPVQQPIQDPTTPAPAVSPGRATRGGPSYIGIGGNLGIAGETTLSEGSFAVISKLGLTNNLSVRPTALIGDDAVFLVPVTLDFPLESVTQTGETQISAAPYLGGGVAISTGDDSNVGFLLSGGVDVPIANQLTANAGVNVSFLDDTNIGLLLGVGYNF